MNFTDFTEQVDINSLVSKFKQQTLLFKTEEDVRAETNAFLRELCKKHNIRLSESSGHEVSSVHGGRADSMYSNIIFEYKAPSVDLTKKKGIDEVIDGRNEHDHGLKHYLINFSLEEHGNSNDEIFQTTLWKKIGVGFNGKSFIFGRYTPGEDCKFDLFASGKTKNIPSGISRTQNIVFKYDIITDFELGFRRLLLYLRSTERSVLSSKSIMNNFGPSTELCRNAIKQIYETLQSDLKGNNRRVITLYKEWDRIFGDIYGEKETDFTKIRKSLCELYGLDEDIDIRSILFTIQTYYNIVLKLLVSDLLTSLKNPLSKHEKPYNLQTILRLFSGKEAELQKIKNFFEVQFFEWFIYSESFTSIMTIIQNILLGLEHIEATASILKPEIVEDVFREVYDTLMPRNVRHLLGEYYTPGWLVEFVLNKVNYTGDSDLSLLDPSCGSGSFVTHAIKRFIKFNCDKLSHNDLIQKVTEKIVGYDINPISVITAQANYILSLGDLSSVDAEIFIPIYMCDSVLIPTVHAKQRAADNAITIKTIVGEFHVPVFENRQASDLFLKEISSHVENYSFEEFIEYLKKNRPEIDFSKVNIDVAKDFYEQVLELHLASCDGFWGTILKNSFAPLFARSQFDIVVGNPPWIAWKAMSDTYRKQTLDIWLSYNIFEKNAYDKITTHDDFAMAVTYVSIDHYCKPNGKLAFVLPQTFLKASKGGEGFRKFCITRDGLEIPFAVQQVFDLLEIQPFRGVASNRASVILFQKGKKMEYPFPNYYVGHNNGNERVNYTDSYAVSMSKIYFERNVAFPIDSKKIRSPWLTMREQDTHDVKAYTGQSAYKRCARKGIEPCGAKGIYLINVISHDPQKKLLLIENIIERSRLESAKQLGVHHGYVEQSLVYPMVGGRNITKWGIRSYLHMIVPHDPTNAATYRGIDESIMKIHFPNGYNWLFYFHDLLLETRIRNAKFFDEKQFPWYRLDNVGPYTWQPYHLVWREQNKNMVACVISTIQEFGINKIVVTDSKVLSCALDDFHEAHYLAAIINAPIITKIIESYTIDTQRGVDVLDNISIPKFDKDNRLHMRLSELSILAHNNFAKSIEIGTSLDDELDSIVYQVFH